jgi:hypothetical protein
MKCHGCNGNFDFVFQLDAGGNLCIDCRNKYEKTNEMVVRRLERNVNYLHDEMDSVFGIRTGGRYALPPAPIHIDKPTMNNLNFSNSIVGAVNTGYVKDLMVNMSKVAINNNEAAQTIKDFTDTLLKNQEIQKEEKEEIIQKLSFLSEQLSLADEKRNDSVIRTILQDVANAVQIGTGLATAFKLVQALF